MWTETLNSKLITKGPMTIKDMLDWLDMLDPLFKQIGSTIKGPV